MTAQTSTWYHSAVSTRGKGGLSCPVLSLTIHGSYKLMHSQINQGYAHCCLASLQGEAGQTGIQVAEAREKGLCLSLSAVLSDSLFCSSQEPQRILLLSVTVLGLKITEPFCTMHGSFLNYKYVMTADFPIASFHSLISA